jgi:predicted transposase/invertase (TIGR01784 family)
MKPLPSEPHIRGMKTIFHFPLPDFSIRRRAKLYASQGKSLNPMQDFVFKALFSGKDDDSQQALRALLSDCIHRPVKDVRVLNSELLPEYLTGKTVRLDVHVSFNDGEQADMEIQIRISADHIPTRSLIYGAKLLAAQARRGKQYRQIRRVYCIFFLNSVLFPGSKKVPRRYMFLEETEHDRLSDVLEVIFYEMPKLEEKARAFIQGREDLKNLPGEQKWCMFFRYRGEEKMKSLVTELCRQEEGIMRAERVLGRMNRNYDKWARALFREKTEMDYYSGMATAREDGLTEGYNRAKAEYEEIRLREQMDYEKKLEAAHRDKLEMARRMKVRGRPLDEIVEDTGLDREAVERL